jgi:hypothetical protein
MGQDEGAVGMGMGPLSEVRRNSKAVVRLGTLRPDRPQGLKKIASYGDKAGSVCHARNGRIQLPRQEAGDYPPPFRRRVMVRLRATASYGADS